MKKLIVISFLLWFAGCDGPTEPKSDRINGAWYGSINNEIAFTMNIIEVINPETKKTLVTGSCKLGWAHGNVQGSIRFIEGVKVLLLNIELPAIMGVVYFPAVFTVKNYQLEGWVSMYSLTEAFIFPDELSDFEGITEVALIMDIISMPGEGQ